MLCSFAALPSRAWFVKFSLACIVFLLYIVWEIFCLGLCFESLFSSEEKLFLFLPSDFFVKKENGEVRRPAGNEIQCQSVFIAGSECPKNSLHDPGFYSSSQKTPWLPD